MTEFIKRTSDDYTADHDSDTRDRDQIGCVDNSDSEDLKSDSSESGSWSIDESIEFMQVAHKPMFNELPTFSVMSASVGGRSISPIATEPISLFNLSISPISSMEDLSNELSVCANNHTPHEKLTEDLTQPSKATGYDEGEHISLEEITAQINTPPPALSRSNKRLNLETIFEDVFLETPKKRRFNGFKRFNSWRIETYQESTNEERINSFVYDQQQNRTDQEPRRDSTSILCNAFDDKINLNT